MKKRFVVFTLCVMCAALLFIPTASHAKRGMPDYVIEKTCGDNNTMPVGKILVAFATYYGSTFQIAEVIAEVFCGSGYEVDLKFAKNVTDAELATYDAVILGSNIYVEDWNAEAHAFLETNKDRLATIPLAYFCACGLLGYEIMDITTREELVDEHYVQPMYGMYDLTPVDVKGFAGAVNYRILKPKDWLLLRLMFMPKGDWTNFAEIVEWAFELQDLL